MFRLHNVLKTTKVKVFSLLRYENDFIDNGKYNTITTTKQQKLMKNSNQKFYTCPMHSEARRDTPGIWHESYPHQRRNENGSFRARA